jgi:putative N6-adenine-specific DNA methylase
MSRYLYQQSFPYFAQIAAGFEQVAADELLNLGARQIRPGYRGVHFLADAASLYRINYAGRLISRVLAPLVLFRCDHRDVLYQKAKAIRWSDFFSLDQTFAVFANVSDSQIRHSQFAALCLKDAVVDSFRAAYGVRPSVDTQHPDLWIGLHLAKDQAIISLDTSGGPLHRRGYRRKSVSAPLQETLAAAIIALSGWEGQKPLYDPMCGSGTLLCEALMRFARMPAGLLRQRFGFEFLPDFDAGLWQQVKAEFLPVKPELASGLIGGSDIDRLAVEAARANCRALPGGEAIGIRALDYRNLDSLENFVIVCNPPYGIRQKSEDDLSLFYRELGDFLKKRCRGADAYIYFGNRQWIKSIGLKPAWKKPLSNGGLDGRLVKYRLY